MGGAERAGKGKKRERENERKKRGEIKRGERRVARRRYVSFRYTTVLSASRTTYLLSLPTLILRLGATFFLTFSYLQASEQVTSSLSLSLSLSLARSLSLCPPLSGSSGRSKLTGAHSCATPEIIFFRKLKRNFRRIG